MELLNQSEIDYSLMFLHIGIITGVLLLAGTTLVMQVISIYYDDIETKHSNEAFYKYWANETTKLEDFSGVPEIDFTYPEGRSIKFTEMKVRKVTEVPASNHRKIPIWYGYVHCVLSAFVIVCILHAVMWWYLASQPVPSVLLDFCKRDLQMCQQRCSKDFDEEYPLVLNNDLLSLTNQVEKAYHHYWSILSVKRQQLKWALGPICISLLFMLIYTFISSIKSLNKRVIKEKSSTWWVLNRFQQLIYLYVDIFSIPLCIFLNCVTFFESGTMEKFNVEMNSCREGLNLCPC